MRLAITYACPAWEFAADARRLKLQRLQNKAPSTIGKFPKCTPVHKLHMSFRVPYIYDYITKLCRQQAEVKQNHKNADVRDIGKMKSYAENIRGLSLAEVKLTTVQI
jgi:hypothetical protein